MFQHYSNFIRTSERCLASVLIALLLLSAVPLSVFAEENASSTDGTTVEQGVLDDGDTASSTQQNAGNGGDITTGPAIPTSDPTNDENASTSPLSGDADTESGTSTATSTATDAQESNQNDGPDGEDATSTPDGTETATTTATSTDSTSGDDGTEGSGGSSGEGEEPISTATTTPGHDSEPIPVLTDNLINDTDTPEGEDVTGERREHDRSDVSIITGNATAQGEVFTDANSTNLRSLVNTETLKDLDFYTFNATGTNEATVGNDIAALARTGMNRATVGTDRSGTDGEADIITGDAIAVFNIANVINSNIINSDGYLYLANQILEENTSLDLQDFFFPGGSSVLAEAANCSLNSCVAEDIEYNFSQMNHATITNDAYIEADSGDNYASADRADIVTGNAYGAANVVNVVNTNIIDSNYRLLTFNAVGDLGGDLILPTQELFDAFFGLPNGMNQLEEGEEASINVDNQNDVDVNNNLDAYAESGQNDATAIDSEIGTGNSESESNVLNKVNENTYGGDVMYLWIRVHGHWSGDVVGLPDGLTWEWTPDGIIIYNENAEITPSEFLGFDVDSYTANITNHNALSINNNINIDAISGFNEVDGGLFGTITTGNTFASANVMNIANTNVIGTNWSMAIINILGDFDGNVTFSQTDLTLMGSMNGTDDPLGPGSLLTFTYTVANSSDKVATDVILRQALDNATTDGATRVQNAFLGDLAPGESKEVTLSAVVDDDIATASVATVKAVARVSAAQGDSDESDNIVTFSEDAYGPGVDPTCELTSDDTSAAHNQRLTLSWETTNAIAAELTDGNTTVVLTDQNVATGSEYFRITEGDTTYTLTASSTNSVVTCDVFVTMTPAPTSSSQGNDGGGNPSRGGGGSSTDTKSIDREELEPIDPDKASMLVITKESNVDEDDIVEAGDSVDYTITLRNRGGTAYDTVVYDIFKNPIDVVLSEQSWELGTILAGEEITIEYTTTFDADTPSGTYTNTASVEAYRHEDDKKSGADPLKLDTAVHTLEIDGVPVVVGNVGVVAYYPGTTGTNALISWETNTPATGQIFYSPRYLSSSYNPLLPNHGYAHESFKFNTPKTKHYMILRDLVSGTEYAYKVRSTSGVDESVGGDYYFTVPSNVDSLAIALPNGQVAQIAGAATSRTVTPITPTPAPSSGPTSYVPTPSPQPKPEPEPQPEPEPSNTSDEGGGIFGRVLNFFR